MTISIFSCEMLHKHIDARDSSTLEQKAVECSLASMTEKKKKERERKSVVSDITICMLPCGGVDPIISFVYSSLCALVGFVYTGLKLSLHKTALFGIYIVHAVL